MTSKSHGNIANLCAVTEQDQQDDTCNVPTRSQSEASVRVCDLPNADNIEDKQHNDDKNKILPRNIDMLRDKEPTVLYLRHEQDQNESLLDDSPRELQELALTKKCLLQCKHSPEYYCHKHKIFCCEDVKLGIHKFCENTEYIDEEHKFRYMESDIKETKELLSVIDNMLVEETSIINQVKQNANEYITEVQKAAEKQQGVTFDKIQKEVYGHQMEVIKIHVDRIVALQKHKMAIQDCLHTLEDESLSPRQSIIIRHHVFRMAQTQANEIQRILTSKILDFRMFIHDESYKNRFEIFTEPKKPKNGAFVSLLNKTLNTLIMHLFNACTAQEGRKPYPLIFCDITFIISAERSNIQAGDYTPNGSYLPDNTILLCDRNNRLIKLDENLGYLEKLPVAGKPYGICVSSDGNYMHVVCDNNKVVSYTLQGPWREVHSFATEPGARGIACHGDRIVTGHTKGFGESFVVIYDSKGTEVSKINLSGYSYNPALSRDGRKLYHGDGNNTVVCRKMEDVQKVSWRYSPLKELKMVRGIDTDRDGNILIVGEGSHNIHQVSEDGKTHRVLIQNMKYMERPWGLFSNRNNNTFCVTSVVHKVCVELYRLDD